MTEPGEVWIEESVSLSASGCQMSGSEWSCWPPEVGAERLKVVGSLEENGGAEVEKKALSGADQDHG